VSTVQEKLKVATAAETLKMAKHLLGGMQSNSRDLLPPLRGRPPAQQVDLRSPYGIVDRRESSTGRAGRQGKQPRFKSSKKRAAFSAALNEAIHLLEQEKKTSKGVFFAPQSRMVSLLQTCLAENASSHKLNRSTRTREVQFDAEDIGGWILGRISTLFHSKHSWIKPPKNPRPMPDVARIAVFGDWGSGLYGAPVIAASLKRDGKFEFIIHLGDIYYSGKDSEVQERFLQFWPKTDAVSLALNGNHEMYAGGNGYLDLVLKEFKQSASTFWLQNNDWTLVGLDTAYEDFDLTADQVAWLGKIIKQAGNRKVILFSHHQPFSLMETDGLSLIKKLKPFLENQRIFAWYWGHEHRCIIYDQLPSWQMYGRLIGHGGVPQERDTFSKDDVRTPISAKPGLAWVKVNRRRFIPGAMVPAGLVLDGPNEYVAGEGDPKHFSPHGYLTLSFNRAHLAEKVLMPDGVEIYSTDLV
jgi:hypothetical protein